MNMSSVKKNNVSSIKYKENLSINLLKAGTVGLPWKSSYTLFLKGQKNHEIKKDGNTAFIFSLILPLSNFEEKKYKDRCQGKMQVKCFFCHG